MKWFKLMMVFAVALVSCSVSFGQAPAPIPDPGPGEGGGISICDACCGLEEQIYNKQQLYAVMEQELDQLDESLATAQDHLAFAIQSGADQNVIQYFQNLIADYQQLIAAKQLTMLLIAEQIHMLWDLWFDMGCDEADC